MVETTQTSVERVTWDAFVAQLDWRQGEHITLIGPTGSGKTTLALALLPMREYVIAYGTKPTGKDRTLMSLVKRDRWRLVKTIAKMPKVILRGKPMRVVFWPAYRTPDDEPRQGWEIERSLREAFTAGGWCLLIDETYWFTHHLGLERWLKALWSQGRSINISVVAGTQRPVDIPLLAYSSATHLFFWNDNDERDLKRIQGLGGLNARLVRSTVESLAPHEVLYVNTRTRQMLITKAPPRK